MNLEEILNPAVVGSAIGFGAGFIQGINYSKFNKYSDYYDSKELKDKNNDRLGNSLFYGSLLPLFDFLIKKVPEEQVKYEFAAGVASSIIGFESGKLIGNRIYKNNDKLGREEQEHLTKCLSNMREATRKEDLIGLFKNTLECQHFVIRLGVKKPNKKLRDNLSRQLADTMDYCELYNQIREYKDSPNPSTILLGLPQHPKAHALILNEGSITDLSIHFDHYSMIERDDIPIDELNVKPHLSKEEVKWNRDIDRVISIADSYKKENSVMIILGGMKEPSIKKEIEASIKFTMAYTNYIKAKHLSEKIKEKYKKE